MWRRISAELRLKVESLPEHTQGTYPESKLRGATSELACFARAMLIKEATAEGGSLDALIQVDVSTINVPVYGKPGRPPCPFCDADSPPITGYRKQEGSEDVRLQLPTVGLRFGATTQLKD